MTTKPCETCGKLLIGVKGDRRFCNACAIRRRKAYQKQYRENRKKRQRTPSVSLTLAKRKPSVNRA